MLEGARRLLEHAPAIKQSVDQQGASLAIDDCYEVWGSGFISIPYDFTLQELQPQLVKLLASTSSANGNGSSSNGVPTSQQMRPMAAARGVGGAGGSSHGLCSRHALQGQQHLGWALSGVPKAAPQLQRQQCAHSQVRMLCSSNSSSTGGRCHAHVRLASHMVAQGSSRGLAASRGASLLKL